MGEEEEEEGRHGGMNPTGSKVNGGSQQNGFSARAALTGDLTREKAAHQSPVGPRDPHLNQLWKLGGGRCRRALTCTGPLIAPPAVHALNPHSPTGDSGTSHFAPQSNLVGRTVKCDGGLQPTRNSPGQTRRSGSCMLFPPLSLHRPLLATNTSVEQK